MSWSDQPIHFIDFEGSMGSGILEFGVVTVQEGALVETVTGKCRATGHIRAEDVAVHGLAESAIESEAPFADEFERFATLRESGALAAHFAQAENTMIKSVWPYARQSSDFSRPGETTNDWGPWVDTGRLYPQFYPSLESGKLGDLVRAFDLQSELDRVADLHCPADRCHYHAALYDALAGALLLVRLRQEVELATQSLPWLLRMSTMDPVKRESMTQGDLF
ncbi:MAG: 3'-5' exonuclease [Opitutaceae bacterium]|tara:strand:- start:12473 stop:13138 length:666 start_codon:yes stop_codon:yes gene_type:complete